MSVLTRPSIDLFEPPPGPVWRFSVDEYHRLIAGGVIREDDPAELLQGWIVPRTMHTPPHDGTVQLTVEAIGKRLPACWEHRIKSSVTLADSEPAPDLAIVRGDETTYLHRHPGAPDIGLVVEVAESSLDQDQHLKSRIYARAGIPSYWIINLVDGRVEVFSNPARTAEAPVYASRQDFRGDDSIPLVLDGNVVAQIRASDLLPE